MSILCLTAALLTLARLERNLCHHTYLNLRYLGYLLNSHSNLVVNTFDEHLAAKFVGPTVSSKKNWMALHPIPLFLLCCSMFMTWGSK